MLGFLKSDPAREELEAAVAEFRALESAYSDRVTRSTQYRKEMNRSREPELQLQSDVWDYGRRQRSGDAPRRHNIPLPMGKAITVKHAFRIAGRLPDIIVDERDSSPQESYRSDSMEKIAWAVTRASAGETTLSAASWNASEIGAGCLDMYMDYTRNIPVYRSVEPTGIYEVPGVDDPHEFQRLYRVWDVPVVSLQNDYRGKLFRGQPINVEDFQSIDGGSGGQLDMARVVQLCDTQRKVRFTLTRNGAVGLEEFEHDLGFVPYVIIPNIGPYENVWGWADYEFVRSLVEYLPLLLAREADALKSYAAGAYIETATGQDSSQIADVIRDGGVVASKRDGKVEAIKPADMPNFAEAHGDRIMELLGMTSFTPDAAWGKPGSGSGADRGLQLQPMLEYTAMKQLNWQRGLSRLYSMAFRMIEKKMVGTSTYKGVRVDGRTQRKTPVSFTFGPNEPAGTMTVDTGDPTALPVEVPVPRTPRELFDGDYDIRFVWRNMVDPDDPAYVLSELNKFTQGAQSLETTLENLGVQAPEDEMKRMEDEANRFPWVRDGVIKLILAQLGANQQGAGGGAPVDFSGALSGALSTMTSPSAGGSSGALNADAGTQALGPSGVGQLYGGA